MITDKMRIFSLAPVESKLDNGETIYLKRLTANDRVEWLTYLTNKTEEKREESLRFALEDSCRLLVKSLCDKDGKRIFEDAETDLIKEIDALTIDRLAGEVLRINGMGGEGKEELKKK